MSSLLEKFISVAAEVNPEAPVVQVAEDVAQTAANPSPENILADIELAISLFKEFKSSTANLHPSVWRVIKLLV